MKYLSKHLIIFFLFLSNYSEAQVATNTSGFYNITIEKYYNHISETYGTSIKELNIDMPDFIEVESLMKSIDSVKINYIFSNENLEQLLRKEKKLTLSKFSIPKIEDDGIIGLTLMHFHVNMDSDCYYYERYGTSTILFRFNCELGKYEFVSFSYSEI